MTKKADKQLECEKYETRGGHCYRIRHLPTGSIIADGYYYLSLARSIAAALVESGVVDVWHGLGPAQIKAATPAHIVEYICSHRYYDIKKAQTIEEFLNGPDYSGNAIDTASTSPLPRPAPPPDSSHIPSLNHFVGWSPNPFGATSGRELARLLRAPIVD